jgi:phosphatidylglycerol:prolipoprotein diacylglycerol transferase
VDRIAFQLGPFAVTWYGIAVATGFWAGAWTAARRAPRAGVSPNTIWDLLWVLILAGIVGARALYVLTYWERDFKDEPFSEIFMVHHGGLVFHGGFIAAVLAGFAWSAWRKLPSWTLADILAPSVALGHAIGRIGCLINGCCYGRECDLPWAIRYSMRHETGGAPVHPTQIYESAASLALAGALAWAFPRRRFDGQIFAAYLISYAVVRSVVELFRGDYPADALSVGHVTPAHWVSLILLIAGLALYFWRRTQGLSAAGSKSGPPHRPASTAP